MKLVLQGRLPSLNDYINSCRRNRYAGANVKKVIEESICLEIKKQIKIKFDTVTLIFAWYEANKKRDKDNIAFAKKFILDALQSAGTLTGDGWNQVVGFSDEFYVDKENPRVEITIKKVV
jgi:hypothetical protein